MACAAKRKAAPTAELYVACLDQLGQFGNQVFQYAFAVAYAELWGLRLRTPRWVGAYAFVGAAEPARARTPLPPQGERVILADRVVLSHAGWKAWVESREPLASLVRASGAPLSGRTLRSRCPQVNAAAIAPDGAAACASTGREHVERCLAAGGMLELWVSLPHENPNANPNPHPNPNPNPKPYPNPNPNTDPNPTAGLLPVRDAPLRAARRPPALRIRAARRAAPARAR